MATDPWYIFNWPEVVHFGWPPGPLAYPLPATEVIYDPDATRGTRQFLSGPFETGYAMLVSPTCSMRAQNAAGYAHPVRVLAVIRSVDELTERGILTAERLGLLRKYDGLVNYMYLPPVRDLPESVVLLYMTVTLHHDIIEGNRIAQLSYASGQQLQRKLAWHSSGIVLPRAEFEPPMD